MIATSLAQTREAIPASCGARWRRPAAADTATAPPAQPPPPARSPRRWPPTPTPSQQIVAERWFYPGDVGIVDAEGWVRMTGRSKDIVNRGGETFSTQDIESAIASYPDVARAAVTAVPDARLGEAVGAWLTLRPDASWTGPESILAHLDAMRLAKQKLPVEWHIVAEMPATASSKVQKHRLAGLDDLATALGVRR